ncbi:glycosyltransferase [Glaciihabitans sp. UYNi722]|uniref:glycosyltransferase n=1 Tax=Glaciihabitans sp. UYNi722 TaxID=3156344 RepID=UPI00339434A9
MAHPGAELYGSDRVFLESVSGMIEDDWEVVVTLPVSGPLVAALKERGAEVRLTPTPVVRKSALRPRGMLKFLATSIAGVICGSRLLNRTRPDAVYVNTMTIPLWQVLARLRRIPVLSHVHEGESSASPLIRSALALPLFLSTTIVANSKFSVGVIEKSFPRLADRSEVIYNGVPGPTTQIDARSSLDSPLRITYIGRLSPRKGVAVAVAAVGILAARGIDTHLDLVGAIFPGYEWYEDQLRQQIVDLGLEGRVQFHGFQPSVWELMAAGDVVVVPSIADEPFGDTAVEAVLSGRTVIASATSGLLEATAGYTTARSVEPGNADALADALQATADHWGTTSGEMRSDIHAARLRHGPELYRQRMAGKIGTIVRTPR